MSIPYSLELAPLAAAYAAGTLAPVTVVRHVYAAIAATRANPIWIHLTPEEEALGRARALGHRKAAGGRFPLYGVPFAVKDNIDVAGQPTTAGCPAYVYEARETAHAVQRLEDAGAILIGKTNLDQFATGLTGTRSPYGACVNPFNPAYIAGGSSSGSALAVACGLVSFALGTDTAGSGRVPAGFTNTVGLKPTRGVVSNHGVVPACRSLDCIAVFALNCDDALAVFEVVQSFDSADLYSREFQPGNRIEGSGRLRCGVPQAGELEFFGDIAARAAFERACAVLAGVGADFVEVDFGSFREAARLLYDGPWVAERYAGLKEFLSTHARDVHPVTLEVVGAASRWTAVDAFEAIHRLQALSRRSEEEWMKMDVLAVPTAGTIYTLDQIAAAPVERNSHLGYYTNFVNLLDLAAIAVPGPFRTDGLPAGVTLIGPAHTDRMLARIGARLHRASCVPLGATAFDLFPAAAQEGYDGVEGRLVLAVVGAHLSGLALNHQLTAQGGRLLETTRTAASYRLFALSGMDPPRPGLVRVANGSGVEIEVELWELGVAAFGSFVSKVPPPLSIGTLTLADGRQVKGFICESYAVTGAYDVSHHGGWRAYLAGHSR